MRQKRSHDTVNSLPLTENATEREFLEYPASYRQEIPSYVAASGSEPFPLPDYFEKDHPSGNRRIQGTDSSLEWNGYKVVALLPD